MANQNQNTGNVRTGTVRTGTQNRGFASMSDADQRQIARMGGTAVSGNREHMAQIGRKGGEASAEARASIRNAARNGQDKKSSAKDRATGPAPARRDAAATVPSPGSSADAS